ncbi:MAG: hypothetical protein ACE148_12135 [Vicinamibacterales bacterium]
MLNRRLRAPSLRGVLVALVFAGVPLAAVASAQSEQADSSPAAQAELSRRVHEQFRVALLDNGVILVPHQAGRGFTTIEISGSGIAIDGAPATGREVRARLGESAGVVLALTYLPPSALREMFSSARETAPPMPAPRSPAVEAPEPASPQPGTERRRSWAERPRSVRSDGRVRIGGDLHVSEDELVRGGVVAVFGSVTIDGAVEDEVVAVGGDVKLGETAEVRGDVTAVGGTIERHPDAYVRGQLHEVAIGWPRVHINRGPWRTRWDSGWLFDAPVSLLVTAMRMAFFALLVGVTVIVARRPVERIADTAASAPWTSAAVGVLAQLAALPILILASLVLLISIIGIPLLAVVPPLFVLALLIALLMGFSGVAYGLGRWATSGFGRRPRTLAGVLALGLLFIWAVTLGGRLMALVGWPVWGVTAALLVVGFVVEYVAWSIGLGAALMTRFGTRPPPTVPAGERPYVGDQPQEPTISET